MQDIQRRSFLSAVTAALTGLALPAWLRASAQAAGIKVAAGHDRFGKARQIGVSSTAFKIAGTDTAGGLFVIEQANSIKGGPPDISTTSRMKSGTCWPVTTSWRSDPSATC